MTDLRNLLGLLNEAEYELLYVEEFFKALPDVDSAIEQLKTIRIKMLKIVDCLKSLANLEVLPEISDEIEALSVDEFKNVLRHLGNADSQILMVEGQIYEEDSMDKVKCTEVSTDYMYEGLHEVKLMIGRLKELVFDLQEAREFKDVFRVADEMDRMICQK